MPTALFSEIERPILLLHGPEGSGKSTCFGFIRSMIDPSILESLDMKRNIDELAIQANEHYCFFIDNVSYLNQEISNTFCRFVTGEAYAKRKLYTNDTTFMMSFKRLLGLNGVTQFATAPDLLDRSIIVNLRRLADDERATYSELREKFSEIKPQLFGALLSLISEMMRITPGHRHNKLPRLADYFKYGYTAASQLRFPPNQFEEVYETNVDLQKEEALEASPVALILRSFINRHGNWTGRSADLYRALLPTATQLGLDKYLHPSTTWLIRKVNESESALYRVGFSIELHKINGERCITIRNITQDSTDIISQETNERVAI